MAELAPLSILITADADDLKAELAAARAALDKFESGAKKGTVTTKGMGGALKSLGDVSGSTRAKIQLVSFQLQDIAVQMQMGTRTSTVLAQQLPQLAGAFGAVGAAVGVLAAVGIPALAFAMGEAETSAGSLEDATNRLDEELGRVEASAAIALSSLDQLRAKYGENAEAVRQLFRELVAVNQQQALNAMNASIIAAGEELSGLTTSLRDFSAARRELLVAKDQIDIGLGPLPSELKAMEDAVASAAATLQTEFGLTSAQAFRIVDALNAVESAAGPDQAAAAAEQLSLAISSAAAEGAQLSEMMANVATNSASAAAAFSQVIARGAQVQSVLSGVTTGTPLDFDPARDMPTLPASFSPRPGGGGGGGAAQDPIIKDLERVQNALMTREEAQIASFERQQATLEEALEKRLLTQQEYDELIEASHQQHSDRMASIDAFRYGDTLQKTGAFLGEMANALRGGNEKMAKISQAFAASEALVNAWRAYNQTLADPSLPFFAKFSAAASVLSAGIGAVNAIEGIGEGGSGSAASGAAASGAAAQAPRPLEARVSLIGSGDFIRAADISTLFDQLQKEAGDRGMNVSFVT